MSVQLRQPSDVVASCGAWSNTARFVQPKTDERPSAIPGIPAIWLSASTESSYVSLEVELTYDIPQLAKTVQLSAVVRYTTQIFWHIDPATPTTTDLAHRVEQLGGLLFTQHWNWTLTDSDAECGLEVCSAWDYYIDHPEPFHRDLCAGRRLAFIGGSDSHRHNPGTCGALTGVWARELSREAIFEALRARRCFATSGSKMVLDFRIDDAPMGSEVTTSGVITVVVRVWGTRPLERLTIMRGWVGSDPLQVSVVHECRLSGMYAEVTWHDDPPPGTSFYYVVAKQAGEDIRYLSNVSIAEGCRAWGSPIWVVRP